MFFIILVIVLIPDKINTLVRLMGLQSVYARDLYKYNSEVPHIVLCGHIETSALRFFCNELFH
jgi:hypothetical protein